MSFAAKCWWRGGRSRAVAHELGLARITVRKYVDEAAPVRSPITFTKNRDRLLVGDIAAAFLDAVLIHADSQRLLSDDHFTVDGTLLEAWASQKSFRSRDDEPPLDGGNPTVNFHGQRRSNATLQSATDQGARLYKKARGREERLGYLGHVVMQHRSGLIVNATVTPADGHGERDAALVMIEGVHGRAGSPWPRTRAMTRGTSSPGCAPCPSRLAQHATGRRSAVDGRTTRHAGYAISQQKRKLVVQSLGWMKTIGGLPKLRHRGGALVTWVFTFAAAAYNLVRLRWLLPAMA